MERVRGEKTEASGKGTLILVAVVIVNVTPIARDMAPKKDGRRDTGVEECFKGAGRGDDLPQWEFRHHAVPRKVASFAVALYCGIGSSCLRTVVNAFERDHIVRGEKSSMLGLKYASWTWRP